jgi:hypothetical protein
MGFLIKRYVLELPEIDNIGAVVWQNRSTVMRHLSTASEGAEAMSPELFRARLDALIDLSHPLAKLTRAMPWAEIEGAISAMLQPRRRARGDPRCRFV